jgi:hypothetical protein
MSTRELSSRQAVHARHLDVHEHHVGVGRGDDFHGGGAVVGLAHDFQIVLRLQDQPQAGAHQMLVVDQHDADAHASSFSAGSRAHTR